MLRNSRLWDHSAGGVDIATLTAPLEVRDMNGDNGAEALKKNVVDLAERAKTFAAWAKTRRFPTEEEWQKLDEGMRAFSGKMTEFDARLAAGLGPFGGAKTDLAIIDQAMIRLDPPEEMPNLNRTYFNLTALTPEEVCAVGSIGAYVPGITDRTRTLVRRSDSQERLIERLDEFQRLNDMLLLCDVLMAGNGQTDYAMSGLRHERIKRLKLWPAYSRAVKDLQRAAQNTTGAGEGLEWVPTILSATLHGLVQAQLRVAALFPQFTMPGKIFESPIHTSDVTAYTVAENTASSSQTAITESILGTGKATWTAIKLACRVFASSEILEDSIIPMGPFIMANMAKVLGRGVEDAIVNGEFNASTLDGTTFNPAGGVKRAWSGLRFYALTAASNDAAKDGGTGTISANLLSMRDKMGIFGADPGGLVYISGFRGLATILVSGDVLTIDKFGQFATVLRGQVANFHGSPVILSEFVTLKNATGVHDATPANNVKGSILGAFPSEFALGERRGITLMRSEHRYVEFDQVVHVGTWRGDFKPFRTPADATPHLPVGIVYNLPVLQ